MPAGADDRAIEFDEERSADGRSRQTHQHAGFTPVE